MGRGARAGAAGYVGTIRKERLKEIKEGTVIENSHENEIDTYEAAWRKE